MRFREPLLIPAIAFAAGILAAHYARFTAIELSVAFGLLLAITAFAAWKAPRIVPFACSSCLLVAGAAVAELHRSLPPPTLIDATAGDTLLIEGCVVEPLAVQDGRARFVVEIEPGARVSVTWPQPPGAAPPKLAYGQHIEFPARVRMPRNYGNPGAFDYVHYLARRDIHWLASISPRAEVRALPGKCGSALQAWIANSRSYLLDRIDSLYADPDLAGFMRALLLGASDRLDLETSAEFRRTGTFHAIVISGLHISLVAGSILWLLRQCFVPVGIRLLIAGIVAWVYAILAGGQAPVMRAAVGFTLALVASATFRKVRVLNVLSAVAILFLIFDPEQLLEASFQLSFAAVAAIGTLSTPLLDRSASRLRIAARRLEIVRPSAKIEPQVAALQVELRLLAQTLALLLRTPIRHAYVALRFTCLGIAAIAEMVILSAGVQFALLLPTVIYFHRLPLTGIVANLVAVPILNGAVALGLTAISAESGSLAWIAGLLVTWSRQAVHWLSALEPDWRVVTPSIVLGSAFLVSLSLYAIFLRTRPRWTWLAFLPTLGFAITMLFDERPAHRPGILEFTAIDVGQGDSLLLVFPTGEKMLIDGGGFPTFKGAAPARRMDIGEQVVSPYLWDRGIRRLDVVAMTHAHDDHAQGLAAILRNFHTGEFWTGATSQGNPPVVMAEAKALGAFVRQPRTGYSRRFGQVMVRVLAPASEYIPTNTAKNNDSLVLEVSYGRRRFLLTGDTEKVVELELVSRGLTSHVDVLKVGHHGSRTSTTPDLIGAVRPVFAMFSVGDGNLYGHPHGEVLQRLRDAHVLPFRTDHSGLTTFTTDGNRLEVQTNALPWRLE